MRIRIYVDGFNFYHGASAIAEVERLRTGTSPAWKWLDINRLCTNVAATHWNEPATVVSAGYLTSKARNRLPGDTARARQQVYLDALVSLGVEPVYGNRSIRDKWKPLAHRADRIFRSDSTVMALVRIDQEKGSDVNLATRLLMDHFTRTDTYDAAVVISNDGDLWEPVHAVRSLGRAIGVINPRRARGGANGVSFGRAPLRPPTDGRRPDGCTDASPRHGPCRRAALPRCVAGANRKPRRSSDGARLALIII